MPQSSFEPSPLAPRRSQDEQARDRDLGFGSVVSRHARQRLLNRDGSFNVVRAGLGFFEEFAPYHFLLTASWTGFLVTVCVTYLLINFIFAAAFLACGPGALAGAGAASMGGRLGQAFFFSVETFATIGYGQIAPIGIPANIVVTIEALVGLMYQALATGLLFARFTRPTPSMVFSDRAVVAPYNDGAALMFRIVNRRRNEIIELEAQVLFSAMDSDPGGGKIRRYTPLALERNKVVFFPLSWTVVHPIDGASPLAGHTRDTMEQVEGEILVLLTGIDQALEQTVHARTSYRADEIAWSARFQSMFLKTDGDSRVGVDVSRLHDIEIL